MVFSLCMLYIFCKPFKKLYLGGCWVYRILTYPSKGKGERLSEKSCSLFIFVVKSLQLWKGSVSGKGHGEMTFPSTSNVLFTIFFQFPCQCSLKFTTFPNRSFQRNIFSPCFLLRNVAENLAIFKLSTCFKVDLCGKRVYLLLNWQKLILHSGVSCM